MSIYPILFSIFFVLSLIGLWQLFAKAGQKGWYVLIPFFNFYIWLKIIKKPMWWFIFIIFPVVNIFTIMLMIVELVKCFNRGGLLEQALSIMFPFFYLPWLGFFSKADYTHPDKRKPLPRSAFREWADAIIFAVIAATVIRMFFIEAYTIPTSSMEKSLLVGDFLFVDKFSYGPRIPNTPLSFPFAHHTMPLTKSVKSYLEWIELKYYRFPGFRKIKNGDAVVFNYPEGDTTTVELQSNESYYQMIRETSRKDVWENYTVISRPVDKRENFIKRCIAISGDKLQIIAQKVYINDKEFPFPENSEFTYFIKTNGTVLNKKLFSNLNITDGRKNPDRFGRPTKEPFSFYYNDLDSTYAVILTEQAANALRKVPGVLSVTKSIQPAGAFDERLFPQDTTHFKWNIDNYGPITVPKAGTTITLSMDNISLYKRIITTYEGNHLEIKNGKIIINGKESNSYTFKMNYYWMMGDNRHNSADSRYWGFVPEDHIVGRAMFVWLSLDENKGWFSGKLRWKKMFRLVK
jgi:signal peptidase I